MNRAARVSKADLLKAATIASETGVVIKFTKDGSTIVYRDLNEARLADDEQSELDRELKAFEDKNGYSRP